MTDRKRKHKGSFNGNESRHLDKTHITPQQNLSFINEQINEYINESAEMQDDTMMGHRSSSDANETLQNVMPEQKAVCQSTSMQTETTQRDDRQHRHKSTTNSRLLNFAACSSFDPQPELCEVAENGSMFD